MNPICRDERFDISCKVSIRREWLAFGAYVLFGSSPAPGPTRHKTFKNNELGLRN